MIRIENTRDWSGEKMLPYWKHIDQAIRKYIHRFADNVSYDEIISDIKSGATDLWIVLKDDQFRAFVISKIITTYTDKKRLIICHFGGKLDDYVRAGLVHLEQYARDQKVQQIQFMGRKGWLRILNPYGYKVQMFDYRKDIDCGMEFA